jgi:hypothetical protein
MVALTQNKIWVSLTSRRPHTSSTRTRRDQKSQRKRSLSTAARSRAQAASGCRRARATAIHGGAESAVVALVGASGVKSQDDEVVGAVERRGGLAMRRSVHEVHQAARASRGRSGAPKVRVRTSSRVASGQLGGSLPGSEVDYSGVLRSIFSVRFQCCGVMTRVVD